MIDRLTDVALDRLESLEALTTVGPWRQGKVEPDHFGTVTHPADPTKKGILLGAAPGNAGFIVAARNALPALLEELLDWRAREAAGLWYTTDWAGTPHRRFVGPLEAVS